MSHIIFWRISAWRPVMVSGLLVLSLAVIPAFAFGQETPKVSQEVKAEVEQQLTISAEAVKETEVDIKAELDLPADYDPVVPNNFINSIGYGFKKFGRNVQKAAYRAFASDQKEAELIKKQSDKALAEAVKLQSLDPGNKRVVGILDDYKSKLIEVRDQIEKVKVRDSDFAKQLAAKVAEDNLFIAPRVLSQMQESLFGSHPEAIPDFVRVKEQTLAVAGEAVLKASDNSSEAAETLKIAAFKTFKTPFSGIAAADAMATAKEYLPQGHHEAFDEAIKASLDNVENNLQTSQASQDLKAKTFQKYVEQLPGQSLSRMKVIEQFQSRANLPPVMIEKMNELKARIAENMSRRIEAGPSEEIRKAMTEAMFEFKNANIEDIKLINEVKDIIPSQEIRAHMKQKHEETVNKFLDKFGNEANARQVTEEFQSLTRKVEGGEVVPDANFFKTLEGLKARLPVDQQKFIDEMEQTGKKEMTERMKSDNNFASRFSTANPADIQYFEKFKGEISGEVPNFEAKFRQIEQRQAENFQQLLDVQQDPAKVRELQQHFNQEVPAEVKQKFEQDYRLNFEDQFRKHEEKAREKEEFFKQKREEFPGQGAEQSGKPRLIGPPVCADGTVKSDYGCEIKFEKKEFDPQQFCSQKGGTWTGTFCQMPAQERSFQKPSPDSFRNPENFQPPTGNFQPPPAEFKPPSQSSSGEVRGASTSYQFDLLESLFDLLGLQRG